MFPTSIFLYIKLVLVAALVASACWLTWKVRGAGAEKEKVEAVSKAVTEIQAKLTVETELRNHYQDLSDNRLTKLLTGIQSILGTQKVITAGITNERARNPKFYNQPLPVGGYAEWSQSKGMIAAAPPTSSSSSSSSPSSSSSVDAPLPLPSPPTP